MVYLGSQAARIRVGSMNPVRKELERLARNGRLTPENVVLAAESPESPLHQYFTWDNDTAAHKCRLEEARTLIRRVKVIVTVKKNTVVVPAYVHDPELEGNEAGYVSIKTVKDEKKFKAKILAEELGRVLAACDRMEAIAEYLGMSGRVQEMVKLTEKTREYINHKFL